MISVVNMDVPVNEQCDSSRGKCRKRQLGTDINTVVMNNTHKILINHKSCESLETSTIMPMAQDMALTLDDKARPGPLILVSLAAPGAPGAKDPRPARFRTTARDLRRTTRPRSIKPVIAKAPPPADQVWWTATTGRRRGGSISRAGSGCGPMLESLSPAPNTPEPERLRRVPSFSRVPSLVAELKKAAQVAATPGPKHAYFTRTASAEMLTQLGEMGI
jgi:hypothetical protein